jgi:acetyl-CoA acyltransferase
MSEKAVIAGVGMTPFVKAGEGDPYDVIAAEAARRALADAGVDYADVQRAFAGYIYGDSTCGQKALYRLGQTGIPIFNVNNNCSSGSSALFLAREAVESGVADVALAVGFEQMVKNAEGRWPERPMTLEAFAVPVIQKYGMPETLPGAGLMYGAAAKQYIEEHGTDPTTFAHIAVKNRRHGAKNPYAQFQKEVTLEEVLESRPIYGPLTMFQCCPTTSGAAAAVVVSQEYAKKKGLRADVEIAAQSLVTDFESSFSGDLIKNVGFDVTAAGAKEVFEKSGIGPEDVKVAEVHDCFTVHEFLIYEAVGFTPVGTAEKFVLDEQNTYGGQVVVNPSGGLISCGHPIGATGLRQCFELVNQLRGQAGDRQVDGVDVAFQHNMGMGSALVTTMYQKVDA